MDEMTARQAERQEGIEQGTEKTIVNTILGLRKSGTHDTGIFENIMDWYSLTEEKARELMERARG